MPAQPNAVFKGALLALFGLVSSSPSVLAQTQSPASVRLAKKFGEAGGWIISGISVEGQHMACSFAPPGDVNTKAAFELSSEGLTVLVATAAKGAEGDDVKGSYDIDGKTTATVLSRVANARNMAFIKAPQLKQLRAGNAKVMTVTAGSEKTVLPLAGIDAALKKAAQCNDKGGA